MKIILSLVFVMLLVCTCEGIPCCDKCKSYKTTSSYINKYVPNPDCPTAIITARQSYTASCGWWGKCTKYRLIYKQEKAFKSVRVKVYSRTWTCNKCEMCPLYPSS